MRSPWNAVLCLGLAWGLGAPVPCHGVSVSGIVLYAAADNGDPNGVRTFDGQLQAELWRTVLGGEWYILGVWSGLPPQSLGAPPLNAANATVEIPLIEGENDFTLLGEIGFDISGDDYPQYAINIYLDGVLDHPGISVLFPRHNVPIGSPTTPSRSDYIYSLDLQRATFRPHTTYDNGVVSVSATAASFLAPEEFGADVDLISPQRLGPSGAADAIGVLKVMVQASPNRSETTEGCQVGRASRGWSLTFPCAVLVFLMMRRRAVAKRAKRGERCVRQLQS